MAEELQQCEVRRTVDKAPHLPIAGTASGSPFNGKLQVGLLFSGDTIALHVIDMSPKYALSVLAR